MGKETTDLELLKKGVPFCWGEIIKIHEIGIYSIVEYKHTINKEIRFNSYVNNDDTCHSFKTLDEAIVKAIVFNRCEINSQADHYFMKMIS